MCDTTSGFDFKDFFDLFFNSFDFYNTFNFFSQDSQIFQFYSQFKIIFKINHSVTKLLLLNKYEIIVNQYEEDF